MKNNKETIEHSEEVLKALNLLKSEGFLIRKLTKEMSSDRAKCLEMKSNNEIMDCTECSCGICAVQ